MGARTPSAGPCFFPRRFVHPQAAWRADRIRSPLIKNRDGLPLTVFYRFRFYLWYGYCFKIKMTRIKSYRKELPYFAGLFLRMVFKH